MRKTRKIWALLLCLCLTVMLMPVTASAATQRRYVTLRPTTAIGGSVGSAKVNVDDTVTSYNGSQSYTVRSVNGTEITVWVYLDNNGTFFFPKASDLWNDVSPVDYVYWSGNSSGQKTENGSGLTSNGSENSNCGLATYYLKAGSPSGEVGNFLWNFTLQYDANDGTGAPAPQTYGTNSKYTKSYTFIIPMQMPTKEGCTFLGWSDNKAATSVTRQLGEHCLVSQTASGYNGGSVTKTLYAVWQEDTLPVTTYTVTYTDGVEGEEVFSDQVYNNLTSGEETPAFEGTPKRDGYTFNGWNPEVADTVTGNATYTAQWTQEGTLPVTTYTVTYTDGVEGEEVFSDQVYDNLTSGEETPAFEGTPKRDGYTFNGWNPEVADTVIESIIYTAKWEKNESPVTTYTLTFETNGGSTIGSVTRESGTMIDLSSFTSRRTGYTFKGWYLDSTLKTKITSVTLDENKMVYADWTENVADPTSVPKTGDTSNIGFWIALLVLATASLTGITLYMRKKKAR